MEPKSDSDDIRIKICQVCGEKAKGFNFNGLSCEACKLFFYRNYLKLKTLKCHRKNTCSITILTRKYCNKCRMDKCLAIGMKRNQKCDSSDKNETTNENTKTFIEKFINSNFQKIETLKQIPKNIIENKFPRKSLELNKYELLKIEKIQNAASDFGDESKVPVVGAGTELFNALEIPEIYLRKIIKFCHNVDAFKLLDKDSQMNIFKQFCCEVMFIRNTFLYDIERNGFYLFADNIGKTSVFIQWEKCYNFKNQDIVQSIRNYARQILIQMENDPIIRDLIIAQLLFKPRLDVSTNIEFLRYHHQLHCHLLLRYLQQKLNNKMKANIKYITLIRLLQDIDMIKTNERMLLIKEIDQKQIPHILAEIYNLE